MKPNNLAQHLFYTGALFIGHLHLLGFGRKILMYYYCAILSQHNGVFGKRSYHAKNVPYLLQTTVLAWNGIYHTSNGL